MQSTNEPQGHHPILHNLRRSINNQTLPPALLFHGPSGVGKKKMASHIAQLLFCEKKNKPCGECNSCQQLEASSHPDVLWIQEQGISIKMAVLSEIQSFVSLQSFSKKRLIIIDESQKMSKQVQNSLLKLLEEPPQGVHFILVCDSCHKLLSTIRSRAQGVRFHPLGIEDLKQIYPEEDISVLKMCRGQVHRLSKWKDSQDVRQEAYLFWKNFLSGEWISTQFLTLIKKREVGLEVIRLFQEILRDARLFKENRKTDLIHLDQEELLNSLAQKEISLLDKLFKKSIKIESDLAQGLDPVLCFENFYHHFYEHKMVLR